MDHHHRKAVNEDPVEIAGVEEAGLVLKAGRQCWIEAWAAIDEIVIASVQYGGSPMLFAHVGINGVRTLSIAEIYPIWTELFQALYRAFPCIERAEDWGQRWAQRPRPFVIYQRSH